MGRLLFFAPRFAALSTENNEVLVVKLNVTLGPFQLHMCRLGLHNSEIFRSIVLPVPVDVVNNFAGTQRASELLCSHDAVDRGPTLLQILGGVCRFMRSAAKFRAVFAGPFTSIGRPQIEQLAAIFTRPFGALAARQSIARLRAPLSLARLATRLAGVHSSLTSTGHPKIPRSADKTNRWFSPHCLKPYRESQLALPGLEDA